VAPACTEVLSTIGPLYAIEADLPAPHVLEAEQQAAALEHRLAVRREKFAPLVTAIRACALAQRSLPGSSLLERQLRDMVVGRENHHGSKAG
jgi:transposase